MTVSRPPRIAERVFASVYTAVVYRSGVPAIAGLAIAVHPASVLAPKSV